MKMTMRKMLAILATLAMLCTVLPLGTLFSAVADDNVIENSTFDDGLQGWGSSSNVYAEDGILVFECTKDWANVYKYANGMKANTDYVYTFRAKANMNSTMNIKINDNWAADSAHVKFDVTTEWQEFTVDVNSGDFKSAPILMFSVNVPASTGMIFYLDYVTIAEKADEPEAPVENPDNIVNNGYFTNDIAGWSASGGTTLTHEDGALHADFNESWGFINAGTYNLKANTEYTLTFKAKSINGGGVTPKMNKSDWSGTVVQQGMNFTGEWAEYEWTFTTTDYTSLMLFFQSGCDANAGQEVWLDDVVLLENAASEPEQPADGNLFVNGDFETGDATGWETWQSTTISADAAKDGAFGAHLVGNGGWGGMLNQTVSVEAGKQYKLSFWINVNANGANIQVKDGSGASIEGAGGWFDSNKKDKLVEWTFYATDDKVLINFCGAGNGTAEDVYVDNFSLVATGNELVEDDALIKNGGFETGDLTNWTNLWNSCQVEFVEGNNSKYAVQITAGSWSQVRQDKIAVEANTDYVLTVDAKYAENFGVVIKTGDDSADVTNMMLGSSSKWATNTLEFNTGDLTSICVLLIGWDGGGDAIIDNVVLAKKGGDEPVEPDEPNEPVDGILVEDFEDALGSDWQLATKGTSGIEDGAMKIEGNAYEEILTSPVIALKEGVTYTISFDIKLINKGEINFQLKNCYEDNAGKGANIKLEYISDASVGTWKTYTYSFKAEDFERYYASMLFVNHAGTDFYVDNIVVTSDEEPAAPSDDLLNATFDSDEFDGILSSSDISVADGELQFNVTKDWGNVYTELAVEANTDYIVSFRAKSALGKSVWVKFHKADWTGDICQETAQLSTSWKEYSYTMNSGDNTSLWLLIQYAGYASEGETVWFDYIKVTKVGGGSEPEVPTGNLIVNGDFETGDATGWETWQSTTIDADAANGGQYGAHLIGNGGWGGMLNQTMTVVPGQEYKLSFWISVNSVGANVQVKDGSGASIEGAGGWFDAKNVDKVVVWNFVATDDKVLINFCGGGTGTAEDLYVDDFVLEAVNPPAPSTSLVTNGDFETGDTSGWESWQSTVVSEDAAKNGKYGVNLLGNGGWGGLLNQTFKVEKGETYIITLWACVNSSGANLQIKGADKVEGECDNTYLDANELSGWTQRTFTVVANADEITLNFCGGGTGKAEDLFIDDIVVTKKGAGPVVDETSPIKNAGFETGDLTNWINLWDSCIYSFDTPGYNGSNYALNYAAEGQWRQIRQDMIPVEPNTDYVVVGYVKNPLNVNIVVKTGDDSANINEIAIENDMSNKWVRAAVEFNSGDLDAICVLLISREATASAIWDDVQVYVKGTEPTDVVNDDEVTEGPMSLDEFGVAINRPATEDANLIENGSFENAEGGQWQSIISDTLYVVDDETAPEGNKSLYFNTSGVTENNKVIFYLDVEPNTDYVFSAWVKGAFISADNRFNATFGVTDWKDKFCVYQDAVFSNKNRQIVPTAWDNEWHLRAVQFNSGVNTKIGIGFAGSESQMWIDGIALYTVDNGIKYADPRQIDYIDGSPLEEGEDGTCADENNLIADSTMSGAAAEEFWASAEGYKNGFVSFVDSKYEYGTSMKYVGDDESCYTNAIKWLTVEPNTEYIFTVDIRVVVSGGGSLNLLDGKKRDCNEFFMVDFDLYTADTTEWRNYAIKFNSGEFDRIGISIVDGGGVALIDNMRLFKAADRIDGGKDDYVEPNYTFGGEDDPHLPDGVTPDEPSTPDSPETGVSVMGAVVAMALVPASAAAALKLRRKKEDEE